MEKYKFLGYYKDAKTIIGFFPNMPIKGDEADIIVYHFTFPISSVDGKASSTPPEQFISCDKSFIYEFVYFAPAFGSGHASITEDKKYIVVFDEGDRGLLLMRQEGHGYAIKIYERVDDEEEKVPEIDLSNERLAEMSKERREQDMAIKQEIIKEFKAHFKYEPDKEGLTGLDFYSYADNAIYGMLDNAGEIMQMYIGADDRVWVILTGDYEDVEEDFESRYFACEDWAQLLINVRKGIEKGWNIGED